MIQIQDDSVSQVVVTPSTQTIQNPPSAQVTSPTLDSVQDSKTAEIDKLLAELDKLSKNLEEKPSFAAETVAESKPVSSSANVSVDQANESSEEKFDFDSFLTDLEKKIDQEGQKHQQTAAVNVAASEDAKSDNTEDFRKNRSTSDMQVDGVNEEVEEPKENFVFKKQETIDLNEQDDDSESEELKAQNVFDMLGLMNISAEDKNQFLDELESMIWDDFIVHDLELLLTSEEYAGARQVLDDPQKNEDARKEALIVYLEALVPDLDEVLYEKALELKSEMMGERLSKMKEGADEVALAKIKEAEGLISQNLWRSASLLLNKLS